MLVYAPFQEVAHGEFATDLLRVVGFSLVGERRVAGDHKHVGDPRQIGGEILRGKVTDAPWTNMGTVPFCGSEPGGSGDRAGSCG
jgi:hypothetical protein